MRWTATALALSRLLLLLRSSPHSLRSLGKPCPTLPSVLADLHRVGSFYARESGVEDFDLAAWVDEKSAELKFTSSLVVAEDARGAIIGAAQITLHAALAAPWSLVEDVCVDRECRRRGIGTDLVNRKRSL